MNGLMQKNDYDQNILFFDEYFHFIKHFVVNSLNIQYNNTYASFIDV